MKSMKLLIALLFCPLLWSCDEEESTVTLPTEYLGPKVPVGNGNAWTYVITDELLEPLSIGVRFDEGALENLPTGSHHADEFTLDLPDEFPVAPYDHITLDWNEKGHEPPGLYDLPHFDVHFYFINGSQRDKITPDNMEAFNRPLAPEHLAPDYLETPGGVPRMGAHIIDLLSPEIAGTGNFTHTFIYGKYDAVVNFLEPMVTKAYLESKPSLNQAIRQPEKWQRSGYYPDKYTINFDEDTGVYSVGLEGLKYVTASN